MKNAVGRDIPEALLAGGKEVFQGNNHQDGYEYSKVGPRVRAGLADVADQFPGKSIFAFTHNSPQKKLSTERYDSGRGRGAASSPPLRGGAEDAVKDSLHRGQKTIGAEGRLYLFTVKVAAYFRIVKN